MQKEQLLLEYFIGSIDSLGKRNLNKSEYCAMAAQLATATAINNLAKSIDRAFGTNSPGPAFLEKIAMNMDGGESIDLDL